MGNLILSAHNEIIADATRKTTPLYFTIHVPQGLREEGKHLQVLTQQILLELQNIKSSILAQYILALLTLRCAETIDLKVQKCEIIG